MSTPRPGPHPLKHVRRSPLWHWGLALVAISLLIVPVLFIAHPLGTPRLAPPTLRRVDLSALPLRCRTGATAFADGLPASALQPADVNRIRVGISNDAMTSYEDPGATLSATGEFRLWEPATRQLLWRGLGGWQVRVSVDSRGFWLAPQQGPQVGQRLGPFAGPIFAEPLAAGSFIRLPDRTRKGQVPTYRGLMWLERASSSPQKLIVVNELDLQDYLRAVVPNELPMRFGLQAVKAQAVAARNYALRPRDKVWPQFDICDSQYCQAYYGQNTETPGSDTALRDTDGLVSLYQGELILALYSSAHGGHSEDYGNAFADTKTQRFPTTTPPYLTGRPDIPSSVQALGSLNSESAARQFWGQSGWSSFDVTSSLYRWQRSWTRPQMEALLATNLDKLATDPLTRPALKPLWQQGQPFGTLRTLTVVARGRSGKAMAVRIETTSGVWVVEREFAIRKLLASPEGKMLPSANLVIMPQPSAPSAQPQVWVIQGGGFGHGVGMSQYGASFLSGKGVQWPRILQHYYSGVAIGSIPLTGRANQAVTTHFFGVVRQGRLHVRSARGLAQPLYFKLNGEGLEVLPTRQSHQAFDISPYLLSGTRNQLTLLPVTGSGSPPVVWIELFPALSASSTPVAGQT